jgi:bacterioferritin-associated ferredoxin
MKYLLCQCNAVTEQEVLLCIRRGARCLDEVGDACLAGTGCGSCQGAIETMIKEETKRRRAGEQKEALFQLTLFASMQPSQ